ncbi:hypothetical protein ACSSS7_002142 [Eimeria intestinalis]
MVAGSAPRKSISPEWHCTPALRKHIVRAQQKQRELLCAAAATRAAPAPPAATAPAGGGVNSTKSSSSNSRSDSSSSNSTSSRKRGFCGSRMQRAAHFCCQAETCWLMPLTPRGIRRRSSVSQDYPVLGGRPSCSDGAQRSFEPSKM